MGTISSHRDLIAWQKAVELGLLVYEISRAFPDDERFGLTSQIRRCSISIASNIAEGFGRGTRTDYIRFLRIARGSLREVDTQMTFAVRLGYVDGPVAHQAFDLINECSKILAGLIRSLEQPK